jgi:hypothetical protein
MAVISGPSLPSLRVGSFAGGAIVLTAYTIRDNCLPRRLRGDKRWTIRFRFWALHGRMSSG